MTDEEKKAIDKLKKSANYFVMPIYETKIILELIEKQSKEMEELHSQIDEHVYNGCDYELCNKKWEDKIKAKIEDKESQINDIKDNLDYDEIMMKAVKRLEDEIEVLQSLLEKE